MHFENVNYNSSNLRLLCMQLLQLLIDRSAGEAPRSICIPKPVSAGHISLQPRQARAPLALLALAVQ